MSNRWPERHCANLWTLFANTGLGELAGEDWLGAVDYGLLVFPRWRSG
jgi:hypothetical protein